MENPKILLQSKIYLFLLQNGLAPAKVIAQKVGLGRALAYKILKQLIALELVEEKHNMGKITFFAPRHPKRIGELLTEKMGKLSQANSIFKSVLGELSSGYNLLLGKPNVQFHEGVGGLQNLHNDILDAGKDIFIISSPVEEGKHEILHLIREQIEKQVAMNIKTRAITPHGSSNLTTTPISDDEKYLITRKVVPADKLNIPAQIIVYGDKVGITNFKEALITVVIESKYISETFRKMFEYMWEKTE